VKVLVSGASGFCGRHLVRHLEAEGAEVHALSLRVPGGPRLHHVDLEDVSSFRNALIATEPDYLLHLAGVSSSASIADYYRINVTYAARLLDALQELGLRCPVLLVGSAAEYGPVSAADVPIHESMPAHPTTHYGISKRAQTELGIAAAHDRPVVIARAFNIVGPGMPGHLAISSFVAQLAACAAAPASPAVLQVGNLDASRDYLHVDTVVRLYWRLIREPRAHGQIVNVCSGIPVSIRELLDRLIALTGMRVSIETQATRLKTGDSNLHYGNPDRLRSLAGDVVPLPLDSALQDMWLETLVHP
jgi:nucleoside-diphosphate-sugar epimerase